MSIKLTVYFEEPFWVGVFEREFEGRYSVCKQVFGPEPKNHQLLALTNNLHRMRFSEPVATEGIQQLHKVNPKRMQRLIAHDLSRKGVSTKAQEAMQNHYESLKQERSESSKVAREEAAQRKYALKQARKKEKHRGH